MSILYIGSQTTNSFVITGDGTGNLVIQTGNTATTAVTIDTSQNATFAGKVASASSLQLATNGTTTAVTIDTNQNVGLGVTPSAWGGFKALQVGGGNALMFTGSNAYGQFYMLNNAYYNGSNYIYQYTQPAASYVQNLGGHQWLNAPSGTAGTAITFTQAMTLDASGNLGVGTTSPAAKLNVSGVAATGIQSLLLNGTTTAYNYATISNTTGNLRIGIEGNSGGIIMSGSSAYSSVICSTGNTNLHLGTNANANVTIDTSGNLMVNQTSPTGKFSVTGTGSSNTGVLAINVTDTSSSFVWASQALDSGMTTGQNIIHIIGKAGSTLNSAYIGYKYSGTAGSASNLLTFGHFASDNLMNLDGNGNLGIGTTSPNNRLHLNTSGSSITLTLQCSGGYGYVNNDGTYVNLASDIGTTGLKFRVARAAPDNAAIIDSSGNLLAGTTSTSGSMSNAAAFVGGSFKTATGSFASPSSGSWTTIATISQPGMYLVHAYIAYYVAGPGNWSNVFVVSYTGGNPAYLWNLSGANQGDINGQIVSSNQIQIYCGAGTGPVVQWTIARFGN